MGGAFPFAIFQASELGLEIGDLLGCVAGHVDSLS